MRYTIGLGGNLGDSHAVLSEALERICVSIAPVIAVSSWYWTRPLTVPGSSVVQGNYLNAVAQLDSNESPEMVLKALLHIEQALGRIRAAESIPWGPRRIDLDIIAVEQVVLSTDALHIPHAHMHQRDFVLQPFIDVEAHWTHPVFGLSLTELLSGVDEHFIVAKADLASWESGALEK